MSVRAAPALLRLLPLALAALGACGDGGPDTFRWADFQDPPVQSRPWVRWWWPGDDVDAGELAREVGLLAQAGFGGAEVQAFHAALDPDVPADVQARRRAVDTGTFFEHLRAALEAARDEGLRLDVTAGSGWPTGGPFVQVEDSLRTLLSSEHPVAGPGPATVTLAGPDKGPFYEIAGLAASIGEPLVRYVPEYAKVVSVLAARVVTDDRDPDVYNLTDTVTLDPSTVQILTDRVKADGTLTWDVPAGDWRIVATWALPDGEEVSLNAYDGTSWVADALDAGRTTDALEHLLGTRAGLEAYQGDTLRGVFTDSFELECERHWSDDFLKKFKELRGYDLEPWLPVVLVPGADNHLFDGAGIKVAPAFAYGADDDRVRWDYARTVSDLFLERGLGAATAWAESRGMTHRVQAYGARIDPVEAAAAVSIPEAEQLFGGGTDLFLKAVSSGAHLYGRTLVGAESLVWSGRDWMTTPRKARAALDKLFAAGVNAVTLHGFPYRQGDAAYGVTGWHPFCSPWSGAGTYSTGIGEADPFWPFWPTLARYAARVQHALRLGEPAADLLVVYPWLGIPATLARLDDNDEPLYLGRFEDEPAKGGNSALLELIDGLLGGKSLPPSALWLDALRPVVADLEDRGYAWDFVNAARLAAATPDYGGVAIDGRRWKGVLVPDVEALEPDAAESLARLAAGGVPVVFAGPVPSRQPGYGGKDVGDARVREAVTAARAGVKVRVGATLAEAPALVQDAGATPGLKHASGTAPVRHVRRRLAGDERVVFLRNPAGAPLALAFDLEGGCRGAREADAFAGTARLADRDEGGRILLELPAWGSSLLVCGAASPARQGADVPAPPEPPAAPARLVALDDWSLRVDGPDVPGGTVQVAFQALGDWRDRPELAGAASAGVYRAAVDAGTLAPGEAAVLDLGWLHGAATVRVNGADAGTLLVPPYALDVTAVLHPGANDVEVTLVPPLRNRLLALGDAGEASARQFKGKSDTRVAAGLVGPVLLRVGRPEAR